MESIYFSVVFSFLHLLVAGSKSKLPGMLFPRDSESRQVKDLSGFWNFRADMSANRNAGFEQNWFAKPLWQVKTEIEFSIIQELIIHTSKAVKNVKEAVLSCLCRSVSLI